MIGPLNVIYINIYEWRDVSNETTAETTYSLRQVRKIGGDPERLDELPVGSSDGS